MTESAFASLLARGAPLLLDGGLATELEAQGESLHNVLWSAEPLRSNPRAIVDAHRAYLDAGADVIISASYQASRAGFNQFDVEADEADRLIASSVTLAQQARDEFLAVNPAASRPLVAASIGPYGAVLNDGSEYRGDYGVPRVVLRLFHEQRLQLLDGTGADVLACETIPSLEEAAELAELLTAADTDAWVSFSCRNEKEISDGTPIEDAAALFATHQRVVAIGVNCTAPHFVGSLLRRIAVAAPAKAILAYPNSGEVHAAADNSWSGEDDSNAKHVSDWLDAGANLVGGCCRVGPSQIAAMRRVLDLR